MGSLKNSNARSPADCGYQTIAWKGHRTNSWSSSSASSTVARRSADCRTAPLPDKCWAGREEFAMPTIAVQPVHTEPPRLSEDITRADLLDDFRVLK
jgi:hypothetical protein